MKLIVGAVFGLLGTGALAACGGGGGGAPAAPAPIPVTQDPFEEDVLHHVDLLVAPEHLPALVPGEDDRVPCTLTYDGVTVEEVGVRLKGKWGSRRALGQKPGFSVRTNEFVKGRTLHGVKRLLLDNGVQDASLMAEYMAYDLWRRAGVPCRRAAHARVTLNGEWLGVYTVVEAYDARFLASRFADATGNLYEGVAGRDISEVEDVGLRTNKGANDRTDLSALADVLTRASDEEFPARLGEVLDVEEWLTYWAVEALVDHFDGYARPKDGGGDPRGPNNWYAYCDPVTGRFSILPHGADQAFTFKTHEPDASPDPLALLAARSAAHPDLRARWFDRMREILDTVWDGPALAARLDAAVRRIRPSVAEGGEDPGSTLSRFDTAVADARRFLLTRRETVLERLSR